jgi:hypothetical protein
LDFIAQFSNATHGRWCRRDASFLFVRFGNDSNDHDKRPPLLRMGPRWDTGGGPMARD